MVLVIIAITVGSGFAIVWMQQQISRAAARSQSSADLLEETSRKLRYLDERIANIHQPVVLQGKVAGSLRPVTESQIVWVREGKLPEAGQAYAVSQPYEASLDLAFVDINAQH